MSKSRHALFRERRTVNVILRPRDWSRLKKLMMDRCEKTSPFVRSLILTELDREEKARKETGPSGLD